MLDELLLDKRDAIAATLQGGVGMVLFIDADDVVEFASPAFCELTGYGEKDLLGSEAPLAGPAGETEAVREFFRQCRALAEPHTLNLSCRKADGGIVPVRATFLRGPASPGSEPPLIGLLENLAEARRTEDALLRSETLLSTLYRISNTVHSTRDPSELYPAIHAILDDVMGAPNFFIALLDEDEDKLAFPYFKDSVDKEIYEIRNISDPETKSLSLQVIRRGEPLLIRKDDLDVVTTDRRVGYTGIVGTAAEVWLGVPLVVAGKTIGVMAVQDYVDPMRYTERDVRLMTAVSEQVALAIERKLMEQALRLSEKRYRTVSDSAFNMETWSKPDGTLEYVSPSCERITGYPPEAFMEDPHLMERIIHRDDLALWQAFVGARCTSRGETLEFRIFREDGRMHWLSVVSQSVVDEVGQCLGLRCSMRDVTDQKTMQKQLRYESLHDSLTGLANRSLATDRISQALERAKRHSHHFAVCFMDIDRFRVVNDSLGHQVGDSLLREVSYRLLRCVRSLDTVSRYAGDEFVIAFDELDSPREAVGVVKRIRQVLAEPFHIGEHEVRITVSMGLVLSPDADSTPDEVLQNANIAMHHAIRMGGNRLKVFTSRMYQLAMESMTLERDLRRGIERDEFFLQYQPIMSLRHDRLAGFEALVRWDHPTRGVIAPGLFIPVAEESGHIIDLGLIVLRKACVTMAGWLADGIATNEMHMSVNLSARQFSLPNLVEQISCILDETGLAPDNLKLEITESAIMDNAENALSMLRRLKNLGITLSIDDFGTGYSSLSYLQKFPVDTLKVDRSFITDMAVNEENIAIVRAVVVLAKSMGLDVVAEGVEELEQLTLLRKIECDNVQGFYYSKPLDPKHVEQLLNDTAAVRLG